MFGENSFLGNDNGKDLLFNPTATVIAQSGFSGPQSVVMGGMHYVYVMNSRYDGGAVYQQKLAQSAADDDTDIKTEVYDEAMWVSIPMLTPGFQLNSVDEGLIPSRVDIKLRVKRPYEQETAENNVLEYEFDFSKFAPTTGDTEVARDALDLVKIVPNPYYAYSAYENTQLDNRVRITNLPARATISIFMLDGTLIKTIEVDNQGIDTALGGEAGTTQVNSVDWDVKNSKGVPIASGVYLVHINAPELGTERTLRWFCLTRPIDLDVF